MARSSLPALSMRVSYRVCFVVAAAVIGALVPSIAETPGRRDGSGAKPAVPTDESVQVQEQLVRADETMAPISREAMTVVGRERPLLRQQFVRRRYARDNTDSGKMSRARRLLMGDGTARPEPFPTPR